MTEHKVKRSSRAHPGVRILDLPRHGWVARWNDPLTRRLQQVSFARLGVTSAPRRAEWARTKSQELAGLRHKASLGQVVTQRVAVDAAVASYCSGFANSGTAESKERPLLAFGEWCAENGIRTMPDIAPTGLMRWRDHVLDPKRCSHMASTRNRWLVTTAIFLRWAMRRGMAPLLTLEAVRHACERVPEPREEIDFLRPAQIRAVLLAAIEYDATARGTWRVAPFVLGLLLSGCRFAELANLRWSEVDIEAGEIRLPAGRVKTKRARVITMTEAPALRELLRALRKRDPEGDAVFRVPNRTAWDEAVRRLIRRHGAPSFTAHGLRRTCGTILTNAPGIYAGASAWHSAKRLGHSVQQSESDYAGQLPGLPMAAATIEAAAGIEDVCKRIVE